MRKRALIITTLILSMAALAAFAAPSEKLSDGAGPVVAVEQTEQAAVEKGCDQAYRPSLAESPLAFALASIGPTNDERDDVVNSRCYVVVNCGSGTLSCYGNSCYGYDQSCPSQQGYCYGTSTGYKYCSACQSCPGNLGCWKYDGRSCGPDGAEIDCTEGTICAACVCTGGTWSCP